MQSSSPLVARLCVCVCSFVAYFLLKPEMHAMLHEDNIEFEHPAVRLLKEFVARDDMKDRFKVRSCFWRTHCLLVRVMCVCVYVRAIRTSGIHTQTHTLAHTNRCSSGETGAERLAGRPRVPTAVSESPARKLLA